MDITWQLLAASQTVQNMLQDTAQSAFAQLTLPYTATAIKYYFQHWWDITDEVDCQQCLIALEIANFLHIQDDIDYLAKEIMQHVQTHKPSPAIVDRLTRLSPELVSELNRFAIFNGLDYLMDHNPLKIRFSAHYVLRSLSMPMLIKLFDQKCKIKGSFNDWRSELQVNQNIDDYLIYHIIQSHCTSKDVGHLIRGHYTKPGYTNKVTWTGIIKLNNYWSNNDWFRLIFSKNPRPDFSWLLANQNKRMLGNTDVVVHAILDHPELTLEIYQQLNINYSIMLANDTTVSALLSNPVLDQAWLNLIIQDMQQQCPTTYFNFLSFSKCGMAKNPQIDISWFESTFNQDDMSLLFCHHFYHRPNWTWSQYQFYLDKYHNSDRQCSRDILAQPWVRLIDIPSIINYIEPNKKYINAICLNPNLTVQYIIEHWNEWRQQFESIVLIQFLTDNPQFTQTMWYQLVAAIDTEQLYYKGSLSLLAKSDNFGLNFVLRELEQYQKYAKRYEISGLQPLTLDNYLKLIS